MQTKNSVKFGKEKLTCPNCIKNKKLRNITLEFNRDNIKCQSCKEKFKIFSGVPDFIPKNHKNFTIEYYESDEPLTLGADKYDSGFDDSYRKETHLDHYKQIKYLIQENNLKINSIIEVGCGTARNLKLFCEKNRQVNHAFGADIALRNVLVAQKQNPSMGFVRADAQLMPVKNNSFDLCLALDIIEHVPDINLFLKEINRMSNYVIIKTPLDHESYYDRIVNYNWKKNWKKKKGHLHKFSKRSLFKIIKDNNFEICNYSYFEHPAKRLFSWVKDRKTFPKKITLFVQAILRLTLPFFIYMKIVPPAIFVLCKRKEFEKGGS